MMMKKKKKMMMMMLGKVAKLKHPVLAKLQLLIFTIGMKAKRIVLKARL